MPAKPLRSVLSLHSLLAIVLPFGVVVLCGILLILPQIRVDAGERQSLLAKAVGMQVSSRLETGAVIVRAAAAMPFDSTLPHHGYQHHLDSLLSSTDSMSSIYTVSPDGNTFIISLKDELQAHKADLINLNLSRNPLFLEVAKGKKPVWSETFLSLVNGGLTVAYGVRINETTVIGEVDLAILTEFLKQLSTEKDNLILIVDHNGQVVADNKGHYTAQQLNIGNIPLVRAGIDTNAPTTGRFDFSGHSMTGSIIHIPDLDWHVMVARTNNSLYRTAQNIALIVMAGILIAMLCGIITPVYLARRFSIRFNELNDYAREIANGEISGEWPSSNITEFNQLSATLQLMASRLQDSETLYRTLFEQLPDGIVLWGVPQLNPLQFNSAAHTMLGYSREEFATISLEDFELTKDEQGRAKVMADLELRGKASFESLHKTKQGKQLPVFISLQLFDIAGQPLVLALHRDISSIKNAEDERFQIEQQLLHAQKLESLGVLAGGIAHDFNNILTSIIGNAELAIMKLNPESPVLENLHRIEKSAARAADLARQMLAYSGKGKFVVESIDLNRLVEEMGHMLEVSISKKAVLRYNLTKPLPAVNVDATQIRQIIMNLVINASEAIGDTSGVIAITTGCLECNESYLQEFWLTDPIPEGLYVSLEIADTGCGMDKGTLEKIFDPFFTTKFTGRGLGMAAVLGIIRGHKGAIKVYSEPGKGSSFKVLLPAGTKPAELFNGETIADNWRGSGVVLLVDDEETVRAIGGEMLRELGFEVITANDGRDAVEQFKIRNDIKVIILDLTMPHMDGEQCFRELRQLDSNVKVIMSSGFSEHEVTQKFAGKGLAGFVQKPYKLSALRKAIKNMDNREDDLC